MTNDNDQEILKHLWNIFKLQEEYTDKETKDFSSSVLNELTEINNDEYIVNLSEELKFQIPTILLEIKSFCEVAEISGLGTVSEEINNIKTKISETK